jgi:MFS family permease
VINFLVGAALVIAMVDVPLFVNVIELNVERSAVISGWVLASLTATMSAASYAGGRFTEQTWYRPPVVVGLSAAAVAFVLMGWAWGVDTSGATIEPVPGYLTMAAELALLGAGFGLVIAPTSAAVVDGAPADQRGSAASLVIVMRLMGLSVGLSGLTAWGLHRFNQLRKEVVLPPIGDPGFADAVEKANAELTTSSLASTFAAAAIVILVALAVTAAMRRPHRQPPSRTHEARIGSNRRPAPDQDDEQEATMRAFIIRHLAPIVTGLAAAIVILLVVVTALLVRLGGVERDLAATEEDLARVEAGAALFASQVQGFQTQLADLAPAVGAGLDEAVSGLATFRTSTIEFDIAIDETVPIDTVIVLDRTIEVPINTTLPINETFDTEITVSGPFGIDLPLDVTVPVNVDVPIDLTVSIPVNESIPIATEVPVKLDLPISIDVAGTELAALAASLEQGLVSFKDVIAGLGG